MIFDQVPLHNRRFADQKFIARLSILLLPLLALALRLYRLDFQELRGDEAFGYFFSLQSFNAIVAETFALGEPHPVASYFVQHSWLQWAGHSEFALRFVTAWFGVLAVVLLYRLALRISFAQQSAWLGALFLAISPYAIWHSQDARMYSMSLALSLATIWLAFEWLQRQRMAYAFAYIFCAWLSLNTHYYAVFLLAALYFFVLTRAFWRSGLQESVVNFLTAGALIAMFFAPWFSQVRPMLLRGYQGNGDSPAFWEMWYRAIWAFISQVLQTPTPATWLAVLAITAIALTLLRFVLGTPGSRRASWFLLVTFCVPLLSIWWTARTRPVFNERYIIAAAPSFYLLLSGASHFWLADLNEWRKGKRGIKAWLSLCHAGALLIVLFSMMGNLYHHYTDSTNTKTIGWRKLAEAMQQVSHGWQPAQVRLVQNFPDPVLWYYYQGPVAHLVLPPRAHDRGGSADEVAKLVAEGVEQVVLALQPAANWDNESIASRTLAVSYTLVAETQVLHWPLQVYVRKPTTFAPLQNEFVNGLQVTGYTLQPPTLSPGAALVVHLRWQGQRATLSGSEKVTVQLLDSAGQLVAQVDRPLEKRDLLENETVVDSYGLLLPTELVAGEYRLIVALYDPEQEGAPRIRSTDQADFVHIQTVVLK